MKATTVTRRVRLVALTTTLVVLGGIALVALRGDGDTTFPVTATFTDASPIVAGNTVKAAGVDVGKVTSVKLVDGLAVVEMRINDELQPMHSDATATIEAKNLLGERFVTIDPGTADAPQVTGAARIPAEHTRREVDLQEVLDAADTPTSTALAALLTALGEGVDGRGKQTSQAMAALLPAMQQSRRLAAVLDEQNELLTTLIDNAQPAAQALAGPHGQDLDRLVTSMTATLSAVADQRTAANLALRELPATLAQARTTLARLSHVAEPTTETLRSLRPLTDDLTSVSTELHAFADAADPALASLEPVLERGTVLLTEAAPLVSTLRPAGGALRSTGQSSKSLAEDVLGDHLTQLMEFMKGWALATSDYDAISHYFKAILPLSPSPAGRTVTGPVPGIKDDPLGGLPVPTDPGLKLPPVTLPDLGLPLGGLLGQGGGSATGLTAEQENSLVSQLLGGN